MAKQMSPWVWKWDPLQALSLTYRRKGGMELHVGVRSGEMGHLCTQLSTPGFPLSCASAHFLKP